MRSHAVRSRPSARQGPFARLAIPFSRLGNVVPLVPGRKFPPNGFELGQWYGKRQTHRDVQRLAARYGRFDIGLVMDGHLMAFDDDGGLQQFLDKRGWTLPQTLRVDSVRGPKYFYRTIRPVRSRSFSRGDIKGVRSLVNVTPRRDRKITVPDDLKEIPYLPKAIEDALAGKPVPRTTRSAHQSAPAPPPCISRSLLIHSAGEEIAFPLDVAELRGERFDWLLGLYSRLEVVAVVARHLGIGWKSDKSFRCVLPGHEERNPSAELLLNRNGMFIYHDWHKRSGSKNEWMTLPEVYASRINGRVVRLRRTKWRVWAVRLLVDAGILAAAPVKTPDLPVSPDPNVQRVWDGFIRLLACKGLLFPPDGLTTTYTWNFVAEWCGISWREGRDAMAKLLAWKMIQDAGKEPMHIAGKAREVTLFRPGKGITTQEYLQQRIEWYRKAKVLSQPPGCPGAGRDSRSPGAASARGIPRRSAAAAARPGSPRSSAAFGRPWTNP